MDTVQLLFENEALKNDQRELLNENSALCKALEDILVYVVEGTSVMPLAKVFELIEKRIGEAMK